MNTTTTTTIATMWPFKRPASHRPILLRLRSSETYIILTVASAIFTDIFVYGIVVPVLPFALQSRSHVHLDSVQKWISIFLAVYGAALFVAAPFCGWIADRLESRRWPMLFGLLLLGASTVMLCVGSNLAVLVAGRVLQGMSAAVVWVVGLALLVDAVGPEHIGSAMGYVTIALSLAYLLAPLLGGIVFARSGYYAVWGMAFGLIILDMFLRLTMIEKKIARRFDEKETPDPRTGTQQLPTLTSTESVIVDDKAADLPPKPVHSANNDPTTAADTIAHPRPALQRFIGRLPPILILLSSRRILSFMFVCTMQSSLITAFDALLPLYVHATFHWSSTGAGLIFLAIVLPTFASPLIGSFADKHGSRWWATAGFVFAAPFYILLRLVDHDTLGQKVLLCALLTLVGLGLTLALTPMLSEVVYAVDAKAARREKGFFGRNGAYAQAFSLFNIAWAAGCFVGPLLGGLVSEASGWGAATLMLGCLCAFTAVPTVVWTGGSIFKVRRARRRERERVVGGGGKGAEEVMSPKSEAVVVSSDSCEV